jgi:outer membrane protein assembly factor BamB
MNVNMKLKCLIILVILNSCCKDENNNPDVLWRNRICGNDLIGDIGPGYPIYKNTVVFHSTPIPGDNDEYSVMHGLDTKTGKEKWRLTTDDFSPKKVLRFSNSDYYYQHNNIFVGADFQTASDVKETYIYGVDIDKGKVMWVTEHPRGIEFGRQVVGRNKTAYVDFYPNSNEFSLTGINIETGSFAEVFKFTQADIPEEMPEKSIRFHRMTQVYTNEIGDEFIALSFNGFNYNGNINKSFMTLFVYNLTQRQKVYSIYVNPQTSIDEGDAFYGRIFYQNGKILVGKWKYAYCFDAFEEREPYWVRSTKVSPDPNSSDEVVYILAYDNAALAFCLGHLAAFDIKTGNLLYDSKTNGTDPNVIDGVIYKRDQGDFQMIDAKTGKELKRVPYGEGEEAFADARPNGADGRIYIHTYTDAYCIRAWGK